MKNSEITHIWANNPNSHGKCGNIKFDNDGIYSYNLMIAAFRKHNVVFINLIPHSNTTSNHQSKIRSAVSHHTTFEYNNIPDLISDIDYIHITPDNIDPVLLWQQYYDIYTALLKRTLIKKYSRTLSYTLGLASVYADKANNLSDIFDLNFTKIEFTISDDIQQSIDKLNQKTELSKLKKFQKSENDRLLWLDGKINNYPDCNNNDVVLRLSPNDSTLVETSKGAIVPLSVCKRLYNSFISQTMPDDKTVGIYILHEIKPTLIKIGCHTINADELTRFAIVLNII